MIHRYLKNVVSLSLDQEKCIGCGLCIQVCPHNVFGLIGQAGGTEFFEDAGGTAIKDAGAKVFIKDKDACMECGACSKNCPVSAIDVNAGVGCFRAVMNSKGTGDCSCDAGCC